MAAAAMIKAKQSAREDNLKRFITSSSFGYLLTSTGMPQLKEKLEAEIYKPPEIGGVKILSARQPRGDEKAAA